MSADGANRFITVWEFHAHPEKCSKFEKAYGPDGDWAQLFRRAHGFIRTELYCDPKMPGRYFTLDFWQSRQEFDAFMCTHAAKYAALDAKCEFLTQEENFIGEYVTPEQARTLLSSRGLELAQSGLEIRLRAAAPADISAMLALEMSAPAAAHWSKRAYELIFDPAAPQRISWVVSNETGTLCGFVVGRIGSDECELENIVVANSRQGRGIGKKLLQALIGSARRKNATRVLLEVRESNEAACRFYENCGFTISSRRKDYYSGPIEDALIYTLSL